MFLPKEIISCQIKFLWKGISSLKGNNFMPKKIIYCQTKWFPANGNRFKWKWFLIKLNLFDRNEFLVKGNNFLSKEFISCQRKKYFVWIISTWKKVAWCAQVTLFRAKYGMCANHALSGEIFYRKSRMTRSENYYPTL